MTTKALLPVDLHRSSGAGPAADRPSAEAYQPAVVIAALVAGLLAGYGIAMPVGAIATYLVCPHGPHFPEDSARSPPWA